MRSYVVNLCARTSSAAQKTLLKGGIVLPNICANVVEMRKTGNLNNDGSDSNQLPTWMMYDKSTCVQFPFAI